MECKYCKSQNLILEQRSHETDDILQANQVALKCADCGKFINWCAKDKRPLYYNNTMRQGSVQQPKHPEKPKQAETKGNYISKADVIEIVDRIIYKSSRLLSTPTIRSAEARAMLNSVRTEVEKL